MENYQSLNISCADGYSLSARFYRRQVGHRLHPILICPATGITQNFYQKFAQWLTQQGFDVLSFDFRGIGQSLHGPLKKSSASIIDWGQLDIPAAIDCLCRLTNQQQVYLLGHSAGGQLLGVAANHAKVAQVIAVAGSTGYVKALKGRTKTLAPLMFQVIFPLSNLLKGYGATKILNMGENLPKNVAKQWAAFCSKPGYIDNACKRKQANDFHAQIHCPITVYAAIDDEIATAENVKQFLALYPNAKTDYCPLRPVDFAQQKIGHMLMFKSHYQAIWPKLIEKLL
ncbi:alpha/beta hydrolase family protein [Acinetobacter larvae]|uniref:Alpha/beta hydrolase n=1 Tax=Acinetobacter larvae TaxID=1789224 RepID=A0A1B2LYG9_9GAMM|nr:alpha/beta fold hydrolase [Acinetobacter larvae]AOA57994.1 alpha/beta hydrolase [Acinetobacter larvae]